MPDVPTPDSAPVRLIENWKTELLRLWSMRVTYFWIVVGAVVLLWPGLAGSIPTWLYFGGGLFAIVSFQIARLLKQPGTDQ